MKTFVIKNIKDLLLNYKDMIENIVSSSGKLRLKEILDSNVSKLNQEKYEEAQAAAFGDFRENSPYQMMKEQCNLRESIVHKVISKINYLTEINISDLFNIYNELDSIFVGLYNIITLKNIGTGNYIYCTAVTPLDLLERKQICFQWGNKKITSYIVTADIIAKIYGKEIGHKINYNNHQYVIDNIETCPPVVIDNFLIKDEGYCDLF